MQHLWSAIVTLALIGAPAEGQELNKAAAQVPPTFPGASSVLWVGAHPDDEVFVAPLLGRLCLEEGLDCAMLVLTRGEKGPCRRPGGCQPDLTTVRSAEMVRSARLFGARLIHWSLPDGGAAADGSAGAWDAASGSHESLVARFKSVIARTRPDVVLTFDPRHGTTCHPDHRAVGSLVLEALAEVDRRPAVYLLETRLSMEGSPVKIRYLPAASVADGVFAFDANQLLASTGLPAWDLTNQEVQIHASQFDAALRRAVRRVARAERVVFLGPAEMVLRADGVWSCR